MGDTHAVPSPGWFDEIAAFLGPAYLRNAFTKGTEQEVAFLVDELGLEPGDRVLDAGCGPGRHALALARRGMEVVGVDRSIPFLALARDAARRESLDSATFVALDVRTLSFDAAFDAVVCLCQGGFGLLGGGDDEETVVARLAGALRPGGRLALSAFNVAFAVRDLAPGESFDAAASVHHETATVRDNTGTQRAFELWTTCYTPRELRLLGARAGLHVDAIHGVAPGRFTRAPPSIDLPEHLLLATRPHRRDS